MQAEFLVTEEFEQVVAADDRWKDPELPFGGLDVGLHELLALHHLIRRGLKGRHATFLKLGHD